MAIDRRHAPADRQTRAPMVSPCRCGRCDARAASAMPRDETALASMLTDALAL